MFLENREKAVPASKYLEAKGELDLNLIELIKAQQSGASVPAAAAEAPSSPKKETEIQIAEGAEPSIEPHQPTPNPTPIKKEKAPATPDLGLSREELEENARAEAEEAETDRLLALEAEEEAKRAEEEKKATSADKEDNESDIDLDMISDGDLEEDE